jgi:hypothetical protein
MRSWFILLSLCSVWSVNPFGRGCLIFCCKIIFFLDDLFGQSCLLDSFSHSTTASRSLRVSALFFTFNFNLFMVYLEIWLFKIFQDLIHIFCLFSNIRTLSIFRIRFSIFKITLWHTLDLFLFPLWFFWGNCTYFRRCGHNVSLFLKIY